MFICLPVVGEPSPVDKLTDSEPDGCSPTAPGPPRCSRPEGESDELFGQGQLTDSEQDLQADLTGSSDSDDKPRQKRQRHRDGHDGGDNRYYLIN